MANEVITLENLGTFKEENDKLYAKKSGNYPDMNVGNILPSVNKVWENTFLFGTTAGSADTTDGKATIQSIHGKTEWNGNTPSYVNITSLKSVLFNLYDKTNEIAKVVASNSSNKGLCISGTGYDAEHLPVVNFGTDGTTFPTSITVTEKISTIGESYLGFEVPSDGYIRVENSPSDVCVSNVWSGYRVLEKAAYQVSQVTINTSSKFSTGMKSCCNGAVYDELTANRYYARISSKLCGASESLTLFATAGNYKIYRMSLSSALNLGYVELGNSTKFALSLTDLTSSSSLTADTMCLNNGYIKFAITTEEDTDYTYTKDDVIVDAETFASEKEVHGTIYVNIDGSYSEIAEYDSSITDYYYRTETSKAGQTIKDHLNGKTIVYQIKSMNKTTFTGTAISPALNLTYDMSDMGTEELVLASGYTATPTLEIAYPMNIRDTVQRYQEHTISVQSFDNLAAKIKDVAGLDIQKQWNAQKNEYDFNVIDTKETIVVYDTLDNFVTNVFKYEGKHIIYKITSAQFDNWNSHPFRDYGIVLYNGQRYLRNTTIEFDFASINADGDVLFILTTYPDGKQPKTSPPEVKTPIILLSASNYSIVDRSGGYMFYRFKTKIASKIIFNMVINTSANGEIVTCGIVSKGSRG